MRVMRQSAAIGGPCGGQHHCKDSRCVKCAGKPKGLNNRAARRAARREGR